VQTVAAEVADSIVRQVNITRFAGLFSGLIVAVGSAVAQLGLTFFVFFFMLYTALSIPNVSKLGINADSKAVHDVLELTDGVRRYIVVTTGLNLMVGTANAILLWIMGIPFALLWGLLAWFLGYIPAVGFWLALIPPVLIAYSQYGLRSAAIIFAGYVLINGSVSNIVQPRVMGASLRISPLIVFISVFIWASLLGSIGAILAIPLTLLIIALLGAFDQTAWVASLMRYVPGSEEQPDEAVGKLRQVWANFRGTLPGG
jgi:predicted PurR-regulated permease PerM